MDVDDENSSKRVRVQSEKEIVKQDEHNVYDSEKSLFYNNLYRYRNTLLLENSTESDSRYMYKFDLSSSYADKKKQSLDEMQNLFP